MKELDWQRPLIIANMHNLHNNLQICIIILELFYCYWHSSGIGLMFDHVTGLLRGHRNAISLLIIKVKLLLHRISIVPIESACINHYSDDKFTHIGSSCHSILPVLVVWGKVYIELQRIERAVLWYMNSLRYHC